MCGEFPAEQHSEHRPDGDGSVQRQAGEIAITHRQVRPWRRRLDFR